MSTRTQLRFVQRIEYENDDGMPGSTERIAQVYRHSDGYPASVLPALKQLKGLLDSTASERGPGYAAAQFIFLDKLRSMSFSIGTDSKRSIRVHSPEALTEPASFEHLNQPPFLLGHGVENPSDGIHGDEEYLYIVELHGQEPAEDSARDWTVKVSEHCGFPRWDESTETAFERARWQFEGSLTCALSELTSNAPA